MKTQLKASEELREFCLLFGSGAEYEPEKIVFYSTGRNVMVRGKTFDGLWCYIEPLHKTEAAINIAAKRAEQTAKALQWRLASLVAESRS